MTTGSAKFERLPTFAQPEKYRIHLEPEISDFSCKNGCVDILINFLKPTDFVKLHFACKEFKSAKLTLENGKEWTGLKFDLDRKWKTSTIRFPEELKQQKATLTIDFDAEILSGMAGFYRSSYKDKEGNTKWLACTQFESESARLAFPCFDEPVYKAYFDIEMLVDEKLTALSNMNVIEERPDGSGKKLVKFATTPLMSSYLIGMVVGEFDYIETHYGDRNIPIRVYTLPGKAEQGRFGLGVAKRAMEWYEDYFNFKSPLPKVDLVAMPDFSMGAMENWGLTTYRELYLTVTEGTTHRMKCMVALIVAHELGHFWFGNLTTMKWWSDLWLKEGFASWMEYLFTSKHYPELKTDLDYVSDVIDGAMKEDSLKSSHKIEVEINDPAELTSIYDCITYNKSNSVIRMLYFYLGEDVFREGLRLYVQRFAFKNAVTDDLWQAWSDVSGQNINKLMSAWTQQMGYPLIKVEEEKISPGKRRLRFQQTRYLADGSTDDKIWQIPITFIRSSDPNMPFHKFLMTEREQEIVIDVPDDEWVKLNSTISGFYRVQYSDDMLKPLLGAVQSRKLDVLDRYNLANDLLALVKASKIPASQYLALFAASVNEEEYLIWQVLIGGLRSFVNILDRNDPELKKKMDSFICSILEPVADKLGWEVQPDEDSHRSQLRALILNTLSKSNHQKTIENAQKLFDEYISDKITLHPDLRAMIFSTASRNEGIERLLKVFENNEGEVKRNALSAAAQTSCPSARESFFKYSIVDGNVKGQDFYLLFVGTNLNGANAQDFAFNYFKEHHKIICDKLGGPTEGVFQHCFEYAISGHSKEEFVDDLENFFGVFEEEAKNACNKVFLQGKESVLLNAKLFKDHRDSIAAFLNSNSPV